MSGEAPLVGPIQGYTITILNHEDEVVLERTLSLNKVGGAHVTNPESLIMMIEDAVFTSEEGRDTS